MNNCRTSATELTLPSKEIKTDDYSFNRKVDRSRFHPALSLASTDITPPKDGIETIEVIDEWALVYCNEDAPVNRNTLGGYTSFFEPSLRTAIEQESKVEEMKDPHQVERDNILPQKIRNTIGAPSSGRSIKFNFKEDMAKIRKKVKHHGKIQSKKEETSLRTSRIMDQKKSRILRRKKRGVKKTNERNNLKEKTFKPSSSFMKLAYHKPKKSKINQHGMSSRKGSFNKHPRKKRITFRKKDPNKTILYNSVKKSDNKDEKLEIYKNKSNQDLHFVPVKRVDVVLESPKAPQVSPPIEVPSIDPSEDYKSEFLQRTSKNSFIRSHIMESYVTAVEDNNSYRNRNSVSIGDAIRNLNDKSTPLPTEPPIDPLNTSNIKKLNLRNGRTKFQETLVGGMVKNNHPLSRARSEYEENPDSKRLFRPFTTLTKLNFISPSLSLYKSDLGNGLGLDTFSGRDSDNGYVLNDQKFSRRSSFVGKKSDGEEVENISDHSKVNNTSSIELDLEDINNLVPFDSRHPV